MNAFQLFEGAAERYEGITLDPMPPERFGEVIEGPAEACGLGLEPGLTARLVEDTRYDDALPLLAFTLKELYEKGRAGGDPEQEPWRADTYESGLGRSTAVGMYPAGASQAGVLDLVSSDIGK